MSTTTEAPEVTHAEYARIRREALERNVLLVCPSIGWWRGMYQLPATKTDITVAGAIVAKNDATLPRAKLMTKAWPKDSRGNSWTKRFTKIESRLSAIKERYSLPFPIQGVRIIPKAKGFDFLQEIYGYTVGSMPHYIETCLHKGHSYRAERLQHEYDHAVQANPNLPKSTPLRDPAAEKQSIAYDLYQAADEFVADLPGVLQQIKTNSSVYALVEDKIPKRGEAMRSKFRLDIIPIELAGSASQELGIDELSVHQDVVRETTHRRVEEAIEAIIAEPRNQLVKELAHLEQIVGRDTQKITTKTMAPLRAAIEKIRMFDFVANEDLLRQIQDLECRVNNADLRAMQHNTAAAVMLREAIAEVRHDVDNANKLAADIQQFGRATRRVF